MASVQANGKSASSSKGKGASTSSKKSKSSTTPAVNGDTAVASGTASAKVDANGAAAPSSSSDSTAEPLLVYATSSRPPREQYDAEQEKIKAALAAKQAQLDKVKQKIADTQGQGPAGEKRKALRAEQNELRSKTAGFKDERNGALNQIKILQEGIQKKIKDMQTAKAKTSFKSTAEIDGRIKELEKQVESGQMRLVDEKRALAEISDLRRSKKSFDAFGTQQEGIDADKAKIDELRAKLDNAEYKGLQDRYTAIQLELDEINKDLDASNSSRDKLYDERTRLNDEVNVLWGRRKESAANFKEANDKYFTRVNEERAKRIERQQAERRAYEDEKRREVNERLLEEARMPAYAAEIEDCTTLIGYFSRYTSGATSVPEPVLSSTQPTVLSNVPQLALRQIEDDTPAGAVMRKKSEQDDSPYAGLRKGKKGGKKATTPTVATESSSSAALNVPFGTVAALLKFDVPPPLSKDDVPSTIEKLQAKKTYFEGNQDRVTKERTAAAEERIAKLEAKTKAASIDDATADAAEDKDVDAATDSVADEKIANEEAASS